MFDKDFANSYGKSPKIREVRLFVKLSIVANNLKKRPAGRRGTGRFFKLFAKFQFNDFDMLD